MEITKIGPQQGSDKPWRNTHNGHLKAKRVSTYKQERSSGYSIKGVNKESIQQRVTGRAFWRGEWAGDTHASLGVYGTPLEADSKRLGIAAHSRVESRGRCTFHFKLFGDF